jgi:2,4-dienoyl-CoA reductase-like NADH-dependent reductase (Old Yellow Enzyme family)
MISIDRPTLASPITIGSMSLRNRLYRAPVLEGAGSSPQPAAVYARHFVPNARAGVALIIQGNTIVTPEGRTSPGMGVVRSADDILQLAPMVRKVQDAGARIVLQLGHGGAFALESWNAEARRTRSTDPWAPSPLPAWLAAVHPGVHVLTTAMVEDLIDRFGVVAAWAREAGYDGVQLAAANAKLLHQFLSPIFNRRTDRYGGDLHARFRLLADIRASIATHAGADFPVWLKYVAYEHTPVGTGVTLEDGVRVGRLAAQVGFEAITPAESHALPNTSISRGEFPARSFELPNVDGRLREAAGSRFRYEAMKSAMWVAARQFSFRPVWNRPVFSAVSAAVNIPVFAVGGIRSRSQADRILAAGEAVMIGVGRPFYAEPELARRWLAGGEGAESTACESCNLCIVPQMLGLPGVCYNPAVRRATSDRCTD